MTGIAMTCGHCGRPMASAVWINGQGYHPECTHGPGFQMPTFTQSPLTEEDIRRIVREEIDRMRPVETRPYGE